MSAPTYAIGITLVVPEGVDAVGVYDDPDGLLVFETDSPYLLSDGVTIQQPVPVFYPSGTSYTDGSGNLLQAIAVSGVTPPEPEPDGITWDASTTWDNGTYWS